MAHRAAVGARPRLVRPRAWATAIGADLYRAGPGCTATTGRVGPGRAGPDRTCRGGYGTADDTRWCIAARLTRRKDSSNSFGGEWPRNWQRWAARRRPRAEQSRAEPSNVEDWPWPPSVVADIHATSARRFHPSAAQPIAAAVRRELAIYDVKTRSSLSEPNHLANCVHPEMTTVNVGHWHAPKCFEFSEISISIFKTGAVLGWVLGHRLPNMYFASFNFLCHRISVLKRWGQASTPKIVCI